MVKLREFFDAVLYRITYGPKWTNEEVKLRERVSDLEGNNDELADTVRCLREELEQKTRLLNILDLAAARQHKALEALRESAAVGLELGGTQILDGFKREIGMKAGDSYPDWVRKLAIYPYDDETNEHLFAPGSPATIQKMSERYGKTSEQ